MRSPLPMQPATRCVDSSCSVRVHGWSTRQPSLVAQESRAAQGNSQQGLPHATASLLRKASLQLLTALAVAIALISLSGCAGGFQGYRAVAPTVTQPASVTVPLGQTATFSVIATGTGTLTYQWYKNGVPIS